MEEQVRGGLLPHETFLWGAVASATPLRGRCGGSAKERIRGRQGLEETRLSADTCLQPFSTHWLIFSHVHIHPKGDSLCRVGEG